MSTAPRLAAAKRDWGHDETGCTVLHIDMDAFYASLEEARHPELKGHPVIIGTGNRAVVSAANYEARKYGINSAMAAARAHQLCPNGIFLPVDMRYYRMMSHRVFTEVMSQITDQIEQVSVDECYMNVAGALRQWKKPTAIGAWIREQVAARYGITCSVGIGGNKLIAKMASTNAKPNGMLMIPLNRHAEFVQMMPLRALPGLGPSQEKKLTAWGVHNVSELAQLDEQTLTQATGSKLAARHLYLASHGVDTREVVPYTPEKSIGSERTFDADTTDIDVVRKLLHWCCNEVAHSLRARELVARTVTVKLRFDDLSYTSKAFTMNSATDSASTLYEQSVALLDALMHRTASTHISVPLERKVRLAGVSASSLSDARTTATQLSLEDLLDEQVTAHDAPKTDRLRGAEQALDEIRRKYGKNAASLGL